MLYRLSYRLTQEGESWIVLCERLEKPQSKNHGCIIALTNDQ